MVSEERIFSIKPLTIQVLTDASECPEGATGKATVYASGGAQSRGKGHFIYTDEWYNNNQIGGNDAVKGDFNGAGYEDLFFSDYFNGSEILFNDGDGTFTNSLQNLTPDIANISESRGGVGVLYYTLETDGFTATKKMVLMEE